jgi:hypothetical protein
MNPRGIGLLALAAGVISTLAGVGLMAVSGQVVGTGWLGLAIGLGGLALIGLWWRSARRPEPTGPPQPLSPRAGAWILAALVGIVTLQFVWLVVWNQTR